MHEQLIRSIIVLRIKFLEKYSSNVRRRKTLEEAHFCAKRKRICNRLTKKMFVIGLMKKMVGKKKIL